MMKVMYYTIEGFDTPNANNHLALTMLETFLKSGIEVYLLQSDRSGPDPKIPESLAKYDIFSCDYVKRKPAPKNNFIARYFEGIKYALDSRKIWKQKARDVDVILVQSTYLSWLSLRLLKSLHKPIVFSIFDLFPNVVFDVGASSNKLIYNALLKLQNIAYNCSDRIVVITDDVKQKLLARGIDEKKLVKIVNWFDEDKISEIPALDNQFIQRYDLNKDKFYVQYAGNFGFTFNYKYVLQVAEKLKNHPKIILQMIGSGTFESEFKQEATEKGLTNIEFYPWQSLDIISDVYSACSIGFIPLSTGVIGNSYPSKLSLIMACGRTFVTCADMNTHYAKDIKKHEIGICVSDNAPEEAAKAILELYENKNLRNRYADNAKKYTYEQYGSKNNAIKFVDVIEEMANYGK